MIGIGIITYNRLRTFKMCLRTALRFVTKNHRILVADDGSTDETRAWIKKMGVECVTGPNVGIARNKNRALWALKDCDAVILLEDDVRILKGGWVEGFVQASKDTREQHFCQNSYLYKKDRVRKMRGGHLIRYAALGNGFCMFFTKKVLEVCGGFDRRFESYGYEHVEFSYRIRVAHLTKGLFPHLVEMKHFVMLRKDQRSALTWEQRGVGRRQARAVMRLSKKEMKAGNLFRPFGPE